MSFIIKLKWFFQQKKLAYIAAILLMAAVNIANIVPARMIGSTIDSIRTGTLTGSALTKTVLLLVGLAVVVYFITFLWVTTLFGNSALLEKMLRTRLVGHLLRMTPSFFQRNRTGDLMALATNDVTAVSNTAGYGVLTLVNTLTGTTVVLVTMVVFTSWKLMLAALLPLPFLAYAINRLGKAMRRSFLASQAAFGKMNDHTLESISGMRVIRSYVQEGYEAEAFDRVTTDVMKKNLKVAMVSSLFQPIIFSIVGISYAIALGFGAYLVFQNTLTLGQLVSFNIYLGQLIWPMIAFGEFINVLQRGSASVDRLDTSMANKPDIREPEDPIRPDRPESVELRSLTFRYPDASAESLSNVSLRVERGETLGVVGRTGSGKSTLLKQLLRLYPLAPEQLLISGVLIERIPLDLVKSWIGYVPQEHMLLSKSIRDNVAFGKPGASDEEVLRALEMASFTIDRTLMKDGLDTVIGENGVTLSGGQKQRLGIARALLTEPEILLLDDALSAVDARTESAILHSIRRERAGRTTWIATHRLSAVNHANWIIVLDEGRIAEEGTHEQLMLLGGWYKRQYDRQQMEDSLLNDAKEVNA